MALGEGRRRGPSEVAFRLWGAGFQLTTEKEGEAPRVDWCWQTEQGIWERLDTVLG